MWLCLRRGSSWVIIVVLVACVPLGSLRFLSLHSMLLHALSPVVLVLFPAFFELSVDRYSACYVLPGDDSLCRMYPCDSHMCPILTLVSILCFFDLLSVFPG